MVATVIIEVGLLLYTLWRFGLNKVTRLVAVTLLSLATFQVAEYMVCEGVGGDSLTWSRIGYVAITMLPPLGLHLAYVIGGAHKRPLLLPAYITAALFSVFFLFVGNSMTGHVCMGNYVIFQLAPGSGALYGLNYYIWLVAGMIVGRQLYYRTKDAHTRRALLALVIGYAIFIVPTTVVAALSRETLSGIPSIMCGFAVLFAIVLGLRVTPAALRKDKS
jgi:hypothetical protein